MDRDDHTPAGGRCSVWPALSAGPRCEESGSGKLQLSFQTDEENDRAPIEPPNLSVARIPQFGWTIEIAKSKYIWSRLYKSNKSIDPESLNTPKSLLPFSQMSF